MNKISLILIIASVLVFAAALVSASDVLVWQGQYYSGTTFNKGTYEFNFSVYDALTGGNMCYTNATTLTTGNFGEWRTEQMGVNSACNNVSKDYYLNVNIDGVDQLPRKRIIVWSFIRKNTNEVSNSSIELDTLKVRGGVKELTSALGISKLGYAQETANATLIAQQDYALKLIEINKNISLTTLGESIQLKKDRVTTAAELAKDFIKYNAEVARSKILEAKKLALLNVVTSEDAEAIEAEATLRLNALNLTAQQQSEVVERALNESLDAIVADDNGIRFCFSDGTNCDNISGNPFNQALNTSSNVTFNNVTADIGFFSWLGSLTSRITKLWVRDVDVSGNIEMNQGNIANVSQLNMNNLGNNPCNVPNGTFCRNNSGLYYQSGI